MIATVSRDGLFTMSNAVNKIIITSLRCLLTEYPNTICDIAEAMKDCQQVQARVIMNKYAEATGTSRSLSRQIRWYMNGVKLTAIDLTIGDMHPGCDKDHKSVHPWQQLEHLRSAYVTLTGPMLGLNQETLTLAKSDRFLDKAIQEVKKSINDTDILFAIVTSRMDVSQCVDELLSDANSNSPVYITTDNLSKWVRTDGHGIVSPHAIFYDESKADQYQGAPKGNRAYGAYLTRGLLVIVLQVLGFIH